MLMRDRIHGPKDIKALMCQKGVYEVEVRLRVPLMKLAVLPAKLFLFEWKFHP